MNTHDVVFAKSAADRLHSIIGQLQEVSLLSAEKVRAKFFHKIHLIQHHPLQSSRQIDAKPLEGNIRVTTVLNYKIYYKVEENKIIILEILLDKEVAKKEL